MTPEQIRHLKELLLTTARKYRVDETVVTLATKNLLTVIHDDKTLHADLIRMSPERFLNAMAKFEEWNLYVAPSRYVLEIDRAKRPGELNA